MPGDTRGKLQYLAPNGRAVYYATQAGEEKAAEHEGQFDYHEVVIKDGRCALPSSSIDVQGFQLMPHQSNVINFFDNDEVANIYNEEVRQLLLRTIPGSQRVHVFDHTGRAASARLRTELNMREPSAIVHNDYTAKSAVQRVQDLLPNEAEQNRRRFAIINVWRSIKGPAMTWPLCFCDSTTRNESDLISVQRVAKDRLGELQLAHFNEQHQWYYFSGMDVNEVAVFKTFDSLDDGRTNRFTLHTAFDDSNAPPDAEPRQSIETRTFVFF